MQTTETQSTQAEYLDPENPEGVVFNPDDFHKPEAISPEKTSQQETPDQIVNLAGNSLGQEYSILHLPDSNFSGRYDEETDDIHYEHNNTTLKTFNIGGKEDYNTLIRELITEGVVFRKSEDEKYATAWVYDFNSKEVRSYVLKAAPKPKFEYSFGNEDDYTANSETGEEQITINLTELFKTEDSNALQTEQKAESFFSVASLASIFTNKENETASPQETSTVDTVKNIFINTSRVEAEKEPEKNWQKLIQIIYEEPKSMEATSARIEGLEEDKAVVKQEVRKTILTQSVEPKEVVLRSPRTDSSEKDVPVEINHVYPEIVEFVHSQKVESVQPQTPESFETVIGEEADGIEEVESMVNKEESHLKNEVIQQRADIQTPETFVGTISEPVIEIASEVQDPVNSTKVSLKEGPSINRTPELKEDFTVDIVHNLKQEVVESVRRIESTQSQLVIRPEVLTEEISQGDKLEESVKLPDPRKIEDVVLKKEVLNAVVVDEIVELKTSEPTELQKTEFEQPTETIVQQALEQSFEEMTIAEQKLTEKDEKYTVLEVLEQEVKPPIEALSKDLSLKGVTKVIIPEASTTLNQIKPNQIKIEEGLEKRTESLHPLQVHKEEVIVKQEDLLSKSNQDIKSPKSEGITQEIFIGSTVSLQVEDKPKKIPEVNLAKEKKPDVSRTVYIQENFRRRFSGVGDVQQESFTTVNSPVLDSNLVAEVSS